jgi:hypothetical protein
MQLNCLWATKQNAQVNFYIAQCDIGLSNARASKEPKKKVRPTNRVPMLLYDIVLVNCHIQIVKNSDYSDGLKKSELNLPGDSNPLNRRFNNHFD